MDTNITTTTQKIKNKFIDIHSHLIYDIDDGSKDLKQSLKQLSIASEIGINDIICTSHISYGKKEKIEKIIKNFNELKKKSKKLNINLYLGNEILYNSEIIDLLKEKKIFSLNNSKYVLIEFRRHESMNFDNLLLILTDLIDEGYKVILAHPELYPNYNKIKYMKKLKEEGILLQLDADSIIKRNNKKVYKFSKKLLKNQLIDFVASDNHCNDERNYNHYFEAYKKMSKKYDLDYINKIFYENQKNIFNSVK